MKKTIICNIPIRDDFRPQVYLSEDASLPSSEKAYYYPLNAFLESQVSKEDEFRVILVIKEDPNRTCEKNTEYFEKEFSALCDSVGAKYSFLKVSTPFAEDVDTHKMFLNGMIDVLGENEKILCDITFGSKDVPILEFNVLTFAEKFLGCEIENMLYGQAHFENGRVTATYLRDIVSLYYLNGITEKLPAIEAKKAKEVYKAMISL